MSPLMDIFGDFLLIGKVVDGLRRGDGLVEQSDGKNRRRDGRSRPSDGKNRRSDGKN